MRVCDCSWRLAKQRDCLCLLEERSIWFCFRQRGSSYPRWTPRLLRGRMTASAPAVLICSARVSESYPLSAMKASVKDPLSNAIAWVQSASCPAVIVNDNGAQFAGRQVDLDRSATLCPPKALSASLLCGP